MSVASEITRINNNIASAYTAVSNKGGTLPQTQNSANLATAINSISGGGGGSIQVINGIIEQYKASNQTISANSFVQFISGTKLADGTSVYEYISAVEISSNKVFIAHRSNYNLNAIICTINGTTITPGVDTLIVSGGSASNYVYQYASAVLIDINKVLVVHRHSNSMYGIICDTNGTTITAGTDTLLTDGNTSYAYISAVLLETNKVFISHRNSNDLNGVVCTINGTTITVGTDTQIATGTNIHQYAVAKLIDTNKVLIAHRGGSNLLHGVICTINGTTITAGTDTRIASGGSVYMSTSIALINTNKVLIAHRNGSYLYGVVCTINNTTITSGTDTQLSDVTNSYDDSSTILVGTNKVFIAHRNDTYLYGLVCTIDNTTITAGVDTKLSDGDYSYNYASAVLFDTSKVFVAHRNDADLYGIVFKINGTNIEDIFTITSATTKIEGLLVTQATTSNAGNVWVLNS